MTLTIPLSVRLVTARQDRHVTSLLRELSFRSVVPGGFAHLTMSLDRPLHIQPDEVQYYAAVYVYGPDGNVVWEGRLEDPGRGVSGDGLIWEMAAVGPSAHAEDLTAPIVYIDQSLERWSVEPGGSTVVDWKSQSVNDQSEPGWLAQYPSGAVVAANASSALEYRFLLDNNQYLAKLHYTYQMGVSDAALRLRLFICDQVCDNPLDVQWTTTKTTVEEVFTADFTRGHRRPTFQVRRTTSLTVPNDTWWARLTDLIVVAMRYKADGALNLTAADYGTTVRAHEVVADVLARLCPRFDGVNALIVPATYEIQSLAYPDGANARQIFEDMMGYEPAYYWAAWESTRDSRVQPIVAHDTFGRFSNCIADGFVRTIASGGWGTADSGHAWQDNLGNASERSVSGGQGRIAVTSVAGSRFETVNSLVTDHVVHIEGCFGVTTAIGDVIRMAAVARWQDVNNYYSAQLELQTNGTVLMSLLKQVAGAQTTLVPGVNIGTNTSSNDFWRVSLSCIGTEIRSIASKAGASTQTAQVVTDTSLATGTRAGVRVFLGSGNTNPLPVTLRFDHIAVVNSNLGWGTMDTGQTWDWTGGNARHFFVAGGAAGLAGVHVVDTASNQLRQTRTDVGVRDGLFYAQVQLDVGTITGTPPASSSCIARVVGRSADVGTFYGAQIVWNTDDTLTLEILKVIGGSPSTIAGPVRIFGGFGIQPVNIILDLDGALIRAKAWSVTGEPDGYLLSVLDTDITEGTMAGLVSRVNSQNTNALPIQFRWTEFKVLGRYARHRFEWTTWPTTVRYEADVADGFDSPGSGQGLFNRARVRYRDLRGRTSTLHRTQDVQELTDAGLDREAFIDAGDSTAADAAQVGDAFLAEHRKPPNAGTLTIARPIVDLVQGGMVQPYEIRPGNLIRIRGVLPRVDTLNATDRDGLTVFRIVAVDYRASSATAQLALDSDPLTVAQALAALQRKR